MSMSLPDGKEIRPVRFAREHIGQVAELERRFFSEPWSESALSLLLTEEYPSFVLVTDTGEVVGYISAQRALDELQIINLAIREGYRGRGFGVMLLETAEAYCRGEEIVSLSLEVRESNSAARGLYKKQGYREAGVRKNFYRQPTENAVVMIKNLI
ncbi:MAG: ribosomal protein S18-alanine N-acetyltransferase [Clostridia bacterium]|nr:ribosomal protein S18-alanine N-acetyltransferase [Clostridia bacterium]